MLVELFLMIADISLISCIMIPLVMVLRIIFHNTPKWTRYIMWGIVAVRLVIPGFIRLNVSMLPAESIFTAMGAESSSGYSSGEWHSDLSSVVRYNDNSISIIRVCSVIWLIGLFFFVMWYLIEQIKMHRRLRFAVEYCVISENQAPIGNLSGCKVCFLDGIYSPFINGVIHPVIYLPLETFQCDIPFIIAHEKVHLLRKDYLWKQLGYIIVAVYWFNPFAWIAYGLFLRDMEYACDEKVVLGHGELFKIGYVNALLHYIEREHNVSFGTVALGRMSIRRRLKAIMSVKKYPYSIVLIAMSAAIIVGALFSTRPAKGEEINGVEKSNSTETVKEIEESLFTALSDKVKYTNYTLEQIEYLCGQLEEQDFSEEDIRHIPELKMNEEGLTYGSDHLGADLISVKSDQGVSGYVYRSELDQITEANSIDEALAKSKEVIIKVYKEDGKEEIGTFTLTDGKESINGR